MIPRALGWALNSSLCSKDLESAVKILTCFSLTDEDSFHATTNKCVHNESLTAVKRTTNNYINGWNADEHRNIRFNM